MADDRFLNNRFVETEGRPYRAAWMATGVAMLPIFAAAFLFPLLLAGWLLWQGVAAKRFAMLAVGVAVAALLARLLLAFRKPPRSNA